MLSRYPNDFFQFASIAELKAAGFKVEVLKPNDFRWKLKDTIKRQLCSTKEMFDEQEPSE